MLIWASHSATQNKSRTAFKGKTLLAFLCRSQESPVQEDAPQQDDAPVRPLHSVCRKWQKNEATSVLTVNLKSSGDGSSALHSEHKPFKSGRVQRASHTVLKTLQQQQKIHVG